MPNQFLTLRNCLNLIKKIGYIGRGLLRAERPNPSSLVRAEGEHTEFIKFIKPQRHKVHRERLRLFMRKEVRILKNG